MVANRLKNLVSLTKEAVRDVRQVLDELVNHASSSTQPSLVKVPVRTKGSPVFRPSPFTVRIQGVRHFSSTRRVYSTASAGSSSSIFDFLFGKSYRVRFHKSPSYLADKLWPYSAFRRPLCGGRGHFPNGLYRHFVNLNARNFSTYGGSASREAVTNLTSGLRCMFNNGGDTLLSLKLQKKHNQNLSYNGCATQRDAKNTFELARSESSNVKRFGSFVEFPLPKFSLSIPTMSFINNEILDTMETDFSKVKAQINRTWGSIESIFDSYGSLPLERRGDNSIRIHFPNSDPEEVEKLLVELGIDEGFVYSNEEIDGLMELSDYSSSEYDEADIISRVFQDDNNAPDLVLSDSESGNESQASDDYYPVLSSSDDLETPLSIQEFNNNDLPVSIIDSSSYSYSEILV